MKLELHPEAIRSLNEKANDLLTLLKSVNDSALVMRLHPDTVIEEITGAIIGETWSLTDDGEQVGKVFGGDERIGLIDDGYESLVRLAEAMQKTKTVRDVISVDRLSRLIFNWVVSAHTRTTSQSMTGYVLQKCESEVRETEIWIPIARLQIESEIKLGRVWLKTMTKEMLDAWYSAFKDKTPEKQAAGEQWIAQQRELIQGFAVATLRVVAEPQRALEIALDETGMAISLLRFFSPANTSPRKVSYWSEPQK